MGFDANHLLCLCVDNARPSDKDDLRSELETMRGMEPHPNILNFLGMCSATGERCMHYSKIRVSIIGGGGGSKCPSPVTISKRRPVYACVSQSLKHM